MSASVTRSSTTAGLMPAWEKMLNEEEMWDVVLFLYDFSGQKPRAREGVHQ